ncbi:MAG: S-adenosylmethionine:tRNA ribosyltransferase-isomerase [Myxococcota bacterium]
MRIRPARDPERPWGETRLLIVEKGEVEDHSVDQLRQLLRPGDLLVLNDAATLPASLRATLAGAAVEVRLARAATANESFPAQWTVVLFGEGDWRDDTDERPAPPGATRGEQLVFRDGLTAEVVRVHEVSPRLVDIRFDRQGEALATKLYQQGRPIQYRHLDAPLALADVQTPYARAPWAVEMPSTGRPLRWPLLQALTRRGVRLAWLTHAAGLSATGDPALDAALPLPERFRIPAETLRAIRHTRAKGGRVVAVGTTVVRALECGAPFRLAGEADVLGVARCRLDGAYRLRIVDAILTGVHSPGESHYALLEAFAPKRALDRAHRFAGARGYLAHELGDLMWVARARDSLLGDEPVEARVPEGRQRVFA